MALFGRKRTSVGLDIGSGLVKVAVMEHSRGVSELVRVSIVPLLADAIVEGEVMDPGIVADAVRTAMEGAGVDPKSDLVTAIGGRDVIVKKIFLERMKEAQAREVIQFEAEQHVPFDVNSVEIDFQILDPSGSEPDMSVLLVAAKKDLIEAKIRLLGDAGLTPAIVDVDAFALHNAFEVNYPEAMTGIVTLINIGNEVSNINILEEGIPILTRDLMVGTRRFREDLQRDHGMSAEDAAALIQGYDRSSQLDSVTAARADEIAVGVERATAFLASSRNSSEISATYISGGGARIPGLSGALEQRMRVRTVLANPLNSLRVRDGALGSLVVDEIAPLLMLPVGLAMRRAA